MIDKIKKAFKTEPIVTSAITGLIIAIVFLLWLSISITERNYEKAENIYKSYSDDILTVPCEEWPIVTNGTEFTFKYPFSESPVLSEYDTFKEARKGACRQYAYEKKKRRNVWTEIDK